MSIGQILSTIHIFIHNSIKLIHLNFLAKTIDGLEEILVQEIESLGGQNVVPLTRAVAFEGDLEVLYKVNLYSRTALKVLLPMTEVEIEDENHLYEEVHSIPWNKIFGLTDTFSVDATVSSEVFTHSKYIALKTKDAIVDKFRRKHNERPNVNPLTPDFTINVHIRGNTMTLSMDSSGGSLHKRGYRVQPIEAPLNEVLAAGLVMLSGWDKKMTFWDPMCGSGTLAIEAAKIALNMPPRLQSHKYQFEKWPNFENELWARIKKEAYEFVPPTEVPKMKVSDKSIQSINSARINIEEAGLDKFIETDRADFFKTEEVTGHFIIMNPPYNLRLKVDEVEKFYKSIGDQLKQKCSNCDAWVFSGNIDAIKSVGLKPNKKFNLHNGPIESKFYNFGIYEGSLSE